ncbi:hypothetical protein ABZ478_32960 [Streptomyces sp. NPDC005706]
MPDQPGFIEGAAGAALAFMSAEPGAVAATRWDACLLLIWESITCRPPP